MIIAISGLVGSGKDSVAKMVAEKLGIKHLNFTFKDAARAKDIPLMEYQEYAKKNVSIDKEFDEMVIAETKKEDCVTSTWLGPWLIKDADLRIWLDASPDARARRISGRDGMTLAEAMDHVRKRDAHNRARYKRLYNVDIFEDRSVFDLIINTETFMPEDSASIIETAVKEKFEEGF
jgi:cytidylate kinase